MHLKPSLRSSLCSAERTTIPLHPQGTERRSSQTLCACGPLPFKWPRAATGLRLQPLLRLRPGSPGRVKRRWRLIAYPSTTYTFCLHLILCRQKQQTIDIQRDSGHEGFQAGRGITGELTRFSWTGLTICHSHRLNGDCVPSRRAYPAKFFMVLG